MRFRKTAGRPPYLNRHAQRQLLFLFGLLVLVLIAMRLAANPHLWSRLFTGAERSATSSATAKTTPGGGTTSGGRNNHRPSAPLQPNEFRAAVHPANSAGKTAAPPTKSGKQSAAGVPHPEKRAGKAKSGAAEITKTKQTAQPAKQALLLTSDGLTLNPAYLERVVEDRELGITYDEFPVYRAVLHHVAGIDPQKLEQQAKTNIPYALLMSDPKSQRGRLIRLEGRLGSLKKMSNSELSAELGSLYEAWIVTADSGADPYRVVFVELPDGLQPRDLYDPPLPVRVTGYFFKVQKYEVEQRGGQPRYHYAPLLLARRLEWNRQREAAPTGVKLAPYIVGFALLLGVILAVVVWRFSHSDREFAEQQLARFDTRKRADVSALNQLPVGESPEEFFRQLESRSDAQPTEKDASPETDDAGTNATGKSKASEKTDDA